MKVLMLIGLGLAALVACGAVPLAAPPSGGPVFCFGARVRVREGRQLMGCADSMPLCRRARGHAERWASVAGLASLGTCQPMELR